MESSYTLIDTTSTKPEEWTEADRIVQKIVNDEDIEQHISAFDLINQFKQIQVSLDKFHVT